MGEAGGRRMSRQKSTDEGRLNELGYKQELQREWTLLHNFGVSFSIIVCIVLAFSPAKPRVRSDRVTVYRDRHNNLVRVWPYNRRSRRDVRWVDRCLFLYHVRWSRHGRDRIGHSICWRSIFLGSDSRAEKARPVRVLGDRLVQSSWPSRRHNGNHVWSRRPHHHDRRDQRLHPVSGEDIGSVRGPTLQPRHDQLLRC